MPHYVEPVQTTWNDVLEFLARELHLSKSDMHNSDEFSELGLDAILARSIAPSLSRLLGIEVHDSVFQKYGSLEAFRTYVLQQLQTNEKTSPVFGDLANLKQGRKITSKTVTKSIAVQHPVRKRSVNTQVPLSIVIQGNPTTSTETIFLLPDGSGSGMAYAGIPRIAPATCVIGLNSPFLGRTFDYNCTIEDLASTWAAEIQARQLHGPYTLGGWSAGGYYSFEVAKILLSKGEVVSKLILLDSPCRTDFEALPMEVVRYLSASGLMGDWGAGPDRTPEWVTAHFEGTLRGVRQYMPTPLQVPFGLPVPEVFIIWCRDGVWNKSEEEEAQASGLDLNVKVTRFLLMGKPDFGTHGWEKLFPGADMFVATMPGNHFTLINKPYVNKLGPLLRNAAVPQRNEEMELRWRRF